MAPRPSTRVKAHCASHPTTPNEKCYTCRKLAGLTIAVVPEDLETIRKEFEALWERLDRAIAARKK
jgi:hypothetical protein